MTQSTPGRPEIGATVTLRVATPVGSISVVGELVEADDERWSVRRRDGSIAVVELASIEAQRTVPPGRARQASPEEVEQAATLGWRAAETDRLGDWLLRASGGFTKRANSALTLGHPGRHVAEALTVVKDWYAARGLSPLLQVVDGATDPALAGQLHEHGWQPFAATHVMTGEISHAIRAIRDDTTPVLLADAPDPAWIGGYASVASELSEPARRLLVNHPNAVFASVHEGEEVIAIARAAIDRRWAGLSAVEVMPGHRRRGLGAAVSVGALREAARRGARQVYLQCSADNRAAVALYERLNLKVHHDYRYFSPGA